MPRQKKLKGTYEVDEDSGQIIQPSVGSRVLNVLTLGHGGQKPVGRANLDLAGEQIRDDRRYRQALGEIERRHALGLISDKERNMQARILQQERIAGDINLEGVRTAGDITKEGIRSAGRIREKGFETQQSLTLNAAEQRNRLAEIDARRVSQLQALKDEFNFRQGEVAKALEKYIPDETTRNQVLGSVLAAPYFTAAKGNIATQATTPRAAEEALAKQSADMAGSEEAELRSLRKSDYERGLGKNAQTAGETEGSAQVASNLAKEKEAMVDSETATGKFGGAQEAARRQQAAQQAASDAALAQSLVSEETSQGMRDDNKAFLEGSARQSAAIERSTAQQAKDAKDRKIANVQGQFATDLERRRQQTAQDELIAQEATRAIREQTEKLQAETLLSGASNQLNRVRDPGVVQHELRTAQGYKPVTIPENSVLINTPRDTNMPPILGPSKSSTSTYNRLTGERTDVVTPVAPGEINLTPLPSGRLQGTNAPGSLILSDPTGANAPIPSTGVIPVESAQELVDRIRRAKRAGVNPYLTPQP